MRSARRVAMACMKSQEPMRRHSRPTTTRLLEVRMIRKVLPALFTLALIAANANAGDLVRGVRYKLSAGDLASGMAAVEDYKRATGVDAEYLDAVGWLARGAEMQRRPELAKEFVAELRREIPAEKPDLVAPL